ncbi:MAG: DUF1304 domain-containing protein [Chitinophagales bacterium]|nr:DUF1304 domain-containing protein [Chitinophagales bacterium]
MIITISKFLILFIALQHFFFLYLEMFAWTSYAPKIFRNFPKDLFLPTKQLAANQGLYNGFLAAGLIWSLFISDHLWSVNVAMFFSSCVAIAGIYGAYSVSKQIFYVQALPALILITLLYFLL